MVSLPGSMSQREPRSPYSGHHSPNWVTLLLEKVERAGLHVVCQKVSINWLPWFGVKELELAQFQRLPVPSSCAILAGQVVLLSITGVTCLLESASPPAFCSQGYIHSAFGSSIHIVRKRIF